MISLIARLAVSETAKLPMRQTTTLIGLQTEPSSRSLSLATPLDSTTCGMSDSVVNAAGLRRCTAIARNGRECRVTNAIFPDARCVFHSTSGAAQARRQEMQRRAQLELQELRKRRTQLKR